MTFDPPFRRGTEADAARLAELINFAGHGLPLYMWRRLAAPGEDPWAFGRDRQAEKARDGKVVVVDFGEGAVAALMGYEIGAGVGEIEEDLPAPLKPLVELESRAPDSWFVQVLACYPDFRGQGLGSRLLDLAEDIARAAQLQSTSLIVANDNIAARRLYDRKGYREAATVPCVKDEWETPTETWVLMIKSLG